MLQIVAATDEKLVQMHLGTYFDVLSKGVNKQKESIEIDHLLATPMGPRLRRSELIG
jgi:hypothetical protein